MLVRRIAFVFSLLLWFVIIGCSSDDLSTPINEHTQTISPSDTTFTPKTTSTPSATTIDHTQTPEKTLTSTSTTIPSPTSIPTPNSLPFFEPSTCRFEYFSPFNVECGYLIVPENRNKQNSPPIRIHVAIFKSSNANPKPDPVIYVAGGGGVNQFSQLDSNAFGASVWYFCDILFQRTNSLREMVSESRG